MNILDSYHQLYAAKDQQDKLAKQRQHYGTTLRERQAAERVEQFSQVYEILKTREAPKGQLHTAEFQNSRFGELTSFVAAENPTRSQNTSRRSKVNRKDERTTSQLGTTTEHT